MKKIIITLFSVMMIFLSACGSTAEVSESAPTTEKSSSVKETKSDKNLYKGAGLVIAVTAPEVRNGGKAESWMPQFFQDSITGNLAKYSKMTVLDRANEDLTKAEQELGETGFYTEENAVQLGQMTNAQYAVFGSITALSTSYELNFRAIDITTNEIKAAYNDRAGTKEIEDGTSVRAIITELLDGLGIGLSEKEKAQLAKTDKKSLNATKSLAKGAAAEKADNLIEALAFYAEAQKDSSTSKEARISMSKMLDGSFSGSDISDLKAKAKYGEEQKEKWEKILKDLAGYVAKNSVMLVYDFSNIKSELSSDNKNIKLTGLPGAKLVFNRHTVLVAKQVLTEWEKTKANKANEYWTRNVNTGNLWPISRNNWEGFYYISGGDGDLEYGLYDNTDYRIKNGWIRLYTGNRADFNVKPQNRYFDDTQFKQIDMTVNLSDLPDDSTFEFRPMQWRAGSLGNVTFMTLEEYNEWAKEQ